MCENPKVQSSIEPLVSHSLLPLSLSAAGPTFADQAAEDLSQRSDFILCQRLGCCPGDAGLVMVTAVLAAGGLRSHVSVDAREALNQHISLTVVRLQDRRVNEVNQ